MAVERRHVTRAETLLLYDRQDRHCPLCGDTLLRPNSDDSDLDAIELDHRTPLAKRGSDYIDNWQLLHWQCHQQKTSQEAAD